MNKTFHVAVREFLATVMTKGFIIGVVFVPLIMLAAIVLVPLLISDKTPAVKGTITVIDHSGAGVGAALAEALSPEALRAQQRAMTEAVTQAITQQAEGLGASAPQMRMGADMAAKMTEAPVPEITLALADPEIGTDAALEPLKRAEPGDEGLLAVIVIDERAVHPDESGPVPAYGSYEWYQRPRLDDRVVDTIKDKIKQVIISKRMAEAGLDAARVNAITQLRADKSQSVTPTGSIGTGADAVLGMMLPFAFMMLLWVAAFTGGQYLLTTTIEEKSSRVMEILLSAASPMQLMTGKIVGQMCVGLLILGIYTSLGMGALFSRNLTSMLQMGDIGLLAVYFFIAFFLIAAMMAAIGSAVNEMREAQSLMTPVMMVMLIPMILWMPIIRNPNGMFATVISFVPPITPFAMVLRIGANEPIPTWQIPVSILVGLASVVGAVWASAKIFRIGVLMYGKPPNLRTLIRWLRMA